MSGSPDAEALPLRPSSFAALAIATFFACPSMGALTNGVNGVVSPGYYARILGWPEPSWSGVVAQGVFEGICFGFVMTVLFAGGVGVLTRMRAPLSFSLRQLARACVGALVSWAIGGALGVLLAALSPPWFASTFPAAPSDSAQLLRFAWVGGSIWGLEIGGVVAVLLALVMVRASWPTFVRKQLSGPTVF